MSKQSAGGKANAIIAKQQAQLRKEQYDLNPNLCLYCQSPILSCDTLKLNETKIKKFCNKSCAGKYNNKDKIQTSKSFSLTCKICDIPIPKKRNYCIECRKTRYGATMKERSTLPTTTKKELFLSRKNWQSARSSIQQHARQIFIDSSSEKSCKICGYDRHYEVCHIKDVSSFSDISTISEINAIDNLVAFCPTHHWEFDNAYVKF